MATTTMTSGFPVPATAAAFPAVSTRAARRRITREAGHALEILGHAVEYLTDEMVHDAAPVIASNPQVQAVQLLMALNRRVYFECPEIPTLSERLESFLRSRFA